MEMRWPPCLETTDLYNPTVPAKKLKVIKKIKFGIVRRKKKKGGHRVNPWRASAT
jgi:hypothetical protein